MAVEMVGLAHVHHAADQVRPQQRHGGGAVGNALQQAGKVGGGGAGQDFGFGDGDGGKADGVAGRQARQAGQVGADDGGNLRIAAGCLRIGQKDNRLAAARHLSRHRHFDGTVYLVFQPAEEGGGGAREMIRDGLFERFPMEAMFGAHNWPGMKVGEFALKSGPCFASSNEFKITLRGKGAHGAMPHLGIDPVPAACQMVQGFQTIISRNKRPIDTGVISVTMIHTGEATNVIPDSCVIEGTVRTFTTEVLDLIERRMKTMAEATAAAFECHCDFEFSRNYPPTVNHEAETAFARRVLGEVVGEHNVHEFEPTMGAEDFSYFLLEKPGCYFLIGNGDGAHRIGGHGLGPCTLHNPSYDFNDDLIPLGGTAWVRMAEAWLGPVR